jgi:hypothetical protein
MTATRSILGPALSGFSKPEPIIRARSNHLKREDKFDYSGDILVLVMLTEAAWPS